MRINPPPGGTGRVKAGAIGAGSAAALYLSAEGQRHQHRYPGDKQCDGGGVRNDGAHAHRTFQEWINSRPLEWDTLLMVKYPGNLSPLVGGRDRDHSSAHHLSGRPAARWTCLARGDVPASAPRVGRRSEVFQIQPRGRASAQDRGRRPCLLTPTPPGRPRLLDALPLDRSSEYGRLRRRRKSSRRGGLAIHFRAISWEVCPLGISESESELCRRLRALGQSPPQGRVPVARRPIPAGWRGVRR